MADDFVGTATQKAAGDALEAAFHGGRDCECQAGGLAKTD
jgi:hypothetical protein